uniref:Uncharacterized protein n=1 Tax=Triticum urartu TaxID=4572 RepID=A0A8R7Q3A9_TRIUA
PRKATANRCITIISYHEFQRSQLIKTARAGEAHGGRSPTNAPRRLAKTTAWWAGGWPRRPPRRAPSPGRRAPPWCSRSSSPAPPSPPPAWRAPPPSPPRRRRRILLGGRTATLRPPRRCRLLRRPPGPPGIFPWRPTWLSSAGVCGCAASEKKVVVLCGVCCFARDVAAAGLPGFQLPSCIC